MGSRVGVPVRVRRVSSELRELRLRSGLGAEEVSTALGMSMSKLSRMENGQRGLQVDDVAALLGLYRVPAKRREELLELVRNAAKPNWWQVQDGRLPETWQDLTRFEKEAVAIHNYETMVIPGLLQTSEYAAAITEGSGRHLLPAEVDGIVNARMKRQTLLHSTEAPSFTFLLEESVLKRLVGSVGLMYRQLTQLIGTASRENVTLQVLPSGLGTHPGLEGPFVVLEFDSHEDLVYLENRASTAFLEQAQHVAEAKNVLQALRDVALPQEDTSRFIARIADELA